MSYWPNKLLVRTVKTTSDSSDVEGYSQFNKGDRRPVVCALFCEFAPTGTDIFYECKFTMFMFYARAGLLLTLRRLMSYIYMEHPFLMFLDHTERRSTVGRTPLDE